MLCESIRERSKADFKWNINTLQVPAVFIWMSFNKYSQYGISADVRKLRARHLTSLHLHSVHCDWDPPPAPSSRRGWSRGVPSPSAALLQNIKRAQWLRPSTISPFGKMSWCRVVCCYISSWESRRLYGSKHTVDQRWYVSHAQRKYQTRVRGKWKETGSLWRWATHPFTLQMKPNTIRSSL